MHINKTKEKKIVTIAHGVSNLASWSTSAASKQRSAVSVSGFAWTTLPPCWMISEPKNNGTIPRLMWGKVSLKWLKLYDSPWFVPFWESCSAFFRAAANRTKWCEYITSIPDLPILGVFHSNQFDCIGRNMCLTTLHFQLPSVFLRHVIKLSVTLWQSH